MARANQRGKAMSLIQRDPYARRRVALPGAALLFAGIVAVSLPAAAQERARFALEELGSFELPLSADVRGARIADNGTLLLWLRSPKPGVLLHRSNSARVLCEATLRQPIAAAFVDADSVVEIVDGARSEVIRASGETCSTRFALPRGLEVLSAAYSAGMWFIAALDSAGRSTVLTVDRLGSGARALGTSDVTSPTVRVRGVHLTATRDGAVLNEVRWPFAWTTIDAASGKVSRNSRPVAMAPGGAKRDSIDFRSLLALGVHPLDYGFLQTFTDSRSDTRVLVLYDSVGRLQRATVLNTSIGLLGTSPSTRRLAMLRRTDRLEVVTYQWRWLSDQPH
jgi:hypothetical protein